MAKRKPLGKKLRLAAALKANRPAPYWAYLRKFGVHRALHVIRRYSLWLLNRTARRHWRSVKIRDKYYT